jgi:hypothetical protein
MTQKLGSHFHHLWRPFLEEARGLSWGNTDSVEDVLFASSAEHNHTRSATQSTECFLM